MDRSTTKLVIDGVAAAGAIGMVLWSIALVILTDPSASALMLLINMSVVAIGAGLGVWIGNIPLAIFGTVVLFLHGLGQDATVGPPILLLATLLGLATYLEWHHTRPSAV